MAKWDITLGLFAIIGDFDLLSAPLRPGVDMHRSTILTCSTLILLLLWSSRGWSQVPEVAATAADSVKNDTAKSDSAKSKKKKSTDKPFEEVVEDFTVIKGLFTFYHEEETGKVYMEILPEQLEKTYLCNITREAGDGALFDSGAILGEFPFFLRKVGKKIFFLEQNLKFRADGAPLLQQVLERDISDALKGSAKIAAAPHETRGSFLIDAEDLFLEDIGEVGQVTGKAKMSYSLDQGNSYFSRLKSFPSNSELEITLYFKSSSPQPLFTLADSRSFIHRYRYSLSTLPGDGYRPRIADDRIGHFYTLYQDYASPLRADPYVRYINRWHLVKSEPKFKRSRPVQPLVFWLENTIPAAYREAVREGVLLWNRAFERLGFENALEVRRMPEDAAWDPADVRYNTIRWIVKPGDAYAMGPFRANPLTGQIYDADIRISADALRARYVEFSEFVEPSSWTAGDLPEVLPRWLAPPAADEPDESSLRCRYGEGMAQQIAFGQQWLALHGGADSEELERFIHQALVHIVAHEVGHTLGLRHNFKASSAYAAGQLQDGDFQAQHGLSGSIMDYLPVHLTADGKPPAQYFQTALGPYDYWAIEYAYAPYDPQSDISEAEMLARIARRAAEPALRFGTDEDAFGNSSRGIDPTCSLWDLGRDPLAFYRLRLDLTRQLWENLVDKFDQPGENYAKLRQVFNQGVAEYLTAGIMASRYIGGIYHHRDHVGDPGARPPFRVVEADQQRAALEFLVERFFSPGSFRFSPELLNRLGAERYWDFERTVFRMSRIDYPIHGIVQVIQAVTLFRLFDALALTRMQDNEVRFEKGESPFTIAEMIVRLSAAVWQETVVGGNIGSYRRELQRIYLYIMEQLLVKSPPGYPRDVTAVARANLLKLRSDIESALQQPGLDTYTSAHLQDAAARITAIVSAQMEIR